MKGSPWKCTALKVDLNYRTGKYTACRHVCASFSVEILLAGGVKGLNHIHVCIHGKQTKNADYGKNLFFIIFLNREWKNKFKKECERVRKGCLSYLFQSSIFLCLCMHCSLVRLATASRGADFWSCVSSVKSCWFVWAICFSHPSFYVCACTEFLGEVGHCLERSRFLELCVICEKLLIYI